MKHWQDIQQSIRNCPTCQREEGTVFAPFDGGWPELPEPRQRAVLFISEAPPTDGGFWTIQLRGKQDDLREKLLPLLKLSPSGPDRGLTAFVQSEYYLLQSFPRPLKGRIAGIGVGNLKKLLYHQVNTHLSHQITFIHPAAILALGKPAATAISMLWPRSKFARAFLQTERLFSVRPGKMFDVSHSPILSATYLPSGRGGVWKKYWEPDIPLFIQKVRSRR